jgi:hypothetical protein
MRYFLPLLLAASLYPAAAQAQYSSRCYRDFLGNIRCSDSTGSTLRTNSDPFGGTRSTYTDPYGNSSTCRTNTDFLGNLRTTCY